MSAKQRILALKLLEKAQANPAYAKSLGIKVEIHSSKKQLDGRKEKRE